MAVLLQAGFWYWATPGPVLLGGVPRGIEGAVQAVAWMGAGYHGEDLDLNAEQVTFRKPGLVYDVQREGDIVLWNADLIKALRHHMGMNQAQFSQELGVRQPTISEWETGAYEPRRSSSKLLSLIAERAGFEYE